MLEYDLWLDCNNNLYSLRCVNDILRIHHRIPNYTKRLVHPVDNLKFTVLRMYFHTHTY